MSDGEIEALKLALRKFALERDWDQFHSPKNLASALIVEAGELLEHFQWLDRGAPEDLGPRELEAISLEIADVFLYLIRLADKLDVDLIEVARRKLELNATKYPVSLARGTHRKYTDL